MQLDFFKDEEVNLRNVDYGDIVITKEGNTYLIVADSDGTDYVAVNLKNNIISEYGNTVFSLFEHELYEKAIRVIKAEELKLGVK